MLAALLLRQGGAGRAVLLRQGGAWKGGGWHQEEALSVPRYTDTPIERSGAERK